PAAAQCIESRAQRQESGKGRQEHNPIEAASMTSHEAQQVARFQLSAEGGKTRRKASHAVVRRYSARSDGDAKAVLSSPQAKIDFFVVGEKAGVQTTHGIDTAARDQVDATHHSTDRIARQPDLPVAQESAWNA